MPAFLKARDLFIKKVAQLAADQTIPAGNFYDLLDVEGKGIANSIWLNISGFDYRFMEVELILDDRDITMGQFDNLSELIDFIGFGPHPLREIPIVTYRDQSSYRIVWYPNAPYYKNLKLRVINNHPTAAMTLHAGSQIVYSSE